MADTREGDVIVRDVAAYFQVWIVTNNGATEPDKNVSPHTAKNSAEAMESARLKAADTDGRIFWIDRDGKMSQISN